MILTFIDIIWVLGYIIGIPLVAIAIIVYILAVVATYSYVSYVDHSEFDGFHKLSLSLVWPFICIYLLIWYFADKFSKRSDS